MKHQMRHWILLLGLLSPAAWAIDESELLPVDEAFAIEGRVAGPDRVVVRWRIADGYYMYRGRIGFNSESPGLEIGDPVLPPGEEKVDEFFGRVQTYRHLVEVELPLRRLDPTVTELELVARSQGCADVGVCYPPHRQRLRLTLPGEAAMPLAEPAIGTGGGLLGNADSGLFGEQALPVDQAFTFETIATSATELLARWTIADGYYLYRDKIRFEIDPGAAVRLGAPRLPPGVAMTDEHFGDVEVYYGQVEVPLPLQRLDAAAGVLELTGHYQGCKEAGICYPPVSRALAVALPAYAGVLATATPPAVGAGSAPVSETQRLVDVLNEGRLLVALPLFFLIGLGLTFTPCVFPTIPILAGIIVGEGDKVGTRRAFTLSLAFVLAMVLVYTAAGIVTAGLGQNVQSWFQNTWVIGGLVVLLLALALSMFGFYELQLPSSWQSKLSQLSDRQRSGSHVGAFIMGAISTLIVGACVAPPLVAVVQHLAETGNLFYGGATLAALGLGQGTPLLIVGATGGRLLPRAGGWMNTVKAVFGVALLALALWMLERIADPTLIMLLWGVLLIASGVYLGAFERIAAGASGWWRLWKALGLVLVALGALELTGAAAGGKDWLQPLGGLRLGATGAGAGEPVSFQKVKSLAELRATLAATDRPAMLDFYADWCIDCRRMDKYTFPEPPVQAALAAGLALKADVTANDAVDQELMRALRIIGPPAIVFFDAAGQEMPQFRVIGYRKPAEFSAHVASAFAAGASPP